MYHFKEIRGAKTISDLTDEVEKFIIYQMKDGEILEIEAFTEFPKKKIMIVEIIKYLIDEERLSKLKIAITFNDAYTKIRKDVLWT